jgi:hypothetical protein
MTERLTRRGFLTEVGVALSACRAGARLGQVDEAPAGPPPPGPTLPPRGRVGPAWIGYGLVKAWHRVDPVGFAALLAERPHAHRDRVCPRIRETGQPSHSTQTHVNHARPFVEAMRHREMTTLISVVNWNSPYQCVQSTSWFRGRIDEISDRIGGNRVSCCPSPSPIRPPRRSSGRASPTSSGWARGGERPRWPRDPGRARVRLPRLAVVRGPHGGVRPREADDQQHGLRASRQPRFRTGGSDGSGGAGPRGPPPRVRPRRPPGRRSGYCPETRPGSLTRSPTPGKIGQ